MLRARRTFAVITRDECHEFDFVVREPDEVVVVAYDVVRVLVMGRMRDEQSHVVHQAGSFEVIAIIGVEIVQRLRFVE